MVWEADIWNTSFVTKTARMASLHLCFILCCTHTHSFTSAAKLLSVRKMCVFCSSVLFIKNAHFTSVCAHRMIFLPIFAWIQTASEREHMWVHFWCWCRSACRGDLVHSACTQCCTLMHCIAWNCTELNCIALLHCIALMHLGIWWKLFDRQLAGGMQHVSMHLCCFVNSFFCLFVLYFGIFLMWQPLNSILYLVYSIFYLVCFVFWSVRNNLLIASCILYLFNSILYLISFYKYLVSF